ncbi:MAG TPA: SH3 domain-containing protein [Spirochaetota bacterium]|nr:SH3 domain-containing protein [Spirochaetota bacterium]
MKKIVLALIISIPVSAFALDVRYCTGDSVRVRSDHSTSASVLTTMNKGSAFNIIGTSDRKETIQDKTDFWYNIVTEDNIKGWIFGAFVSDSDKKSSAKTSGVTVEDEYVFTTTKLFPEPKADWEKAITLKYRSKVKVMEKSGQMSSAVDQLGHWTKIQCGNITGWTLDSFLTKSDDINANNASLYNVCLFNDPQIMHIVQTECTECGDPDEKLKCYKNLSMNKRTFNPAPEFNTDDQLFILKDNGITEDKVKSLRLETNEGSGACYLLFDTAKSSITYKEEKFIGLYINRKRFSGKTPVVMKSKAEPADIKILDPVSFCISEEPSVEYHEKSPAFIKKALKSNYSIVCTPIESSGYRIYQFNPVNKENTWDSFTAITNGDQLVYGNYGRVITSFTSSGRVYVSINEWMPNTGCVGRKLLLLEEGMIKLVLSQYYYAD